MIKLYMFIMNQAIYEF